MLTLRAHKEDCQAMRRPCLRGFLDFGVFFMSCVRECQWEVERRSHVRPEVSAVMHALHSDIKGKYETAWGLTDDVPVLEGVGQGCVAAPTRSKLMLGVIQRTVARLASGYKFTGATGGIPQIFYADDGCFLATNLADLQMAFDTCWMVTRAMGLNITVKKNGKKTAWSGTYWKGNVEHHIEGWTMQLPDGTTIPQVETYKYLGGEERSGWKGRHELVEAKALRQCCQLLRLLGRVPTLGPEQLRRAMSLALAGVLGYFARSTPISLATCKSIEEVRAQVLRQRGICPGEPRLQIYAPPEGGGLGPGQDTGEAGEANLSCCCFNTADSKSGRTTDN